MYCPRCGEQLDVTVKKCYKCGFSFWGIRYGERKRIFKDPPSVKKQKNDVTPIRMTYDNGIAVGEGMTREGTKFKHGSTGYRGQPKVASYDRNTAQRKIIHNYFAEHKTDEEYQERIKGNLEERKRIAQEILGDYIEDED